MKTTYWQPLVFMALVLALLVGNAQTQAAPNRDDDDNEWYGLVESRPNGTEIGNWTIGGQTFTADANTDFEYEHGPLNVGSCAEVKYNAGTTAVIKIESQEPQECNGGGDDDDGDGDGHLDMYGLVDSFPPSLIGNWVVNGVTYTANANTEFEQEHGTFDVGACIEVEYDPITNVALEIETEESYKCTGNGGGSNGNSYNETDGIVDSFPPNLIGDWVVDGVIYTANAGTRFEQEHGPFFAGGCVEVKYVSATSMAVEIETQEASHCVIDRDDDDPETKLYGLIEAFPAGMIGTWTVGGTDFEATANTEFEQEDGPFAVGVCAEVEYVTNNGVNTAAEIETTEPYHCNGGTTYNTAYGAIDSFPTGLFGTWVIAGGQYAASTTTNFDQSHGAYAVGGCVEVKYYTDTGVNHAVKIETDDDCTPGGGGGDDDDNESKIYATIDSFPTAPFIGTWGIGGLMYEATNGTEFEQEHGAFAVGACVEAEFGAGSPAILHEVETEHAYKCEGNGGEGGHFTVFGTVEAYPNVAGWVGNWQVSGVNYVANNATYFEQEHGFFAVGAYVKVKYVENAGTFTALEIETHVAPGGGNSNNAGILDAHDTSDDWSDWVIDGVVYKADTAIDVGNGAAAPQVGGRVAFNSYETAGVQYITRINQASQIFLPVLSR